MFSRLILTTRGGSFLLIKVIVSGSRGYVPALFESQSKSEGRAGGIMSAKLLTPAQRIERAKKAAKARWKK